MPWVLFGEVSDGAAVGWAALALAVLNIVKDLANKYSDRKDKAAAAKQALEAEELAMKKAAKEREDKLTYDLQLKELKDKIESSEANHKSCEEDRRRDREQHERDAKERLDSIRLLESKVDSLERRRTPREPKSGKIPRPEPRLPDSPSESQ